MLKILFIGDIVGKIGRKAVKQVLPKWKEIYEPDLVIANAENLAHGKGVTESTLNEMLEAGIDFFTSGNHVWDNGKAEEIFKDDKLPIIRPANYPAGLPGAGYKIVKTEKKKVLIANVNGRVFFFKENFDCPFRTLEKIISEAKKKKIKHIIVDFHAEATSEKTTMGRYFDGQISLLIGTHTHIATADEEILPKGTGYITDIGMAGFKDGSLGVNLNEVIEQFLYQTPQKFELPEDGNCVVNAIFAIIDEKGLCEKIERLSQTVKI
ncbi:TIGR00282 family metallophosphoesterase [Candidatus Falkowbacteria bacterium]|nr:TIGR00282 family metallophosphoesterase [Candidatus Falkowbacteria bacterium]